jgi:chromosome partitioning protein
MNVIVVANIKGGVGKSTLAVNFAVCAAKENNKVLLIDTDLQGSSICFRAIRELDDIQATSITTNKIHVDVNNFTNFDYVIVDAGGQDNRIFRSAVAAAAKGLLIVPIKASQSDLWATQKTYQVLDEIRSAVDIKAFSLLNDVEVNTTSSKETKTALVALNEEYNVELLNTIVHSRQDFVNAFAAGKGVIEYKSKGSDKKAEKEMRKLYEEVKSHLQKEKCQ